VIAMSQVWHRLDARAHLDHLGYIPAFLDEDDPDDARTQLDKNYAFGGFRPQSQWHLLDPVTMAMQYPGDPPTKPLWMGFHRQERIYVYPYGYVAVVQPDNSFVMARMD
jgi:hypothetical protein